eukprot:351874-Chlamydomonas_euryale.AAC.6
MQGRSAGDQTRSRGRQSDSRQAGRHLSCASDGPRRRSCGLMVSQFGRPRPCSAGASHTRAVAGTASCFGRRRHTAAGCRLQRQMSGRQWPHMLWPSATCGGASDMTTSGWSPLAPARQRGARRWRP